MCRETVWSRHQDGSRESEGRTQQSQGLKGALDRAEENTEYEDKERGSDITSTIITILSFECKYTEHFCIRNKFLV